MEKSDYPKEYIELATRFFQALEALKQRDDIRGMGTFIREHDIDKRNFYKVKDFSIRFKPEWLVYLIRDYNVSAEWLTGRGKCFQMQKQLKNRKMVTLSQSQKDILIQWINLCKKNKSLDEKLCFYYYIDDQEAFIEFDNKKYSIPYNLKDEWLGIFSKLLNEGIIKHACKPYGSEVMRNLLFKFVSLDALEVFLKTINS